MNCPKCNSNINQNETFCKVCGFNFNQSQSTQEIKNNQVPNWDWNTNTLNNTNTNGNNPLQADFQSQVANQSNQGNNIQQEKQTKPQTVFNTNYSQNYVNDDLFKKNMLIEAYIGKNSDKLRNGGFSWCTFFFGAFYVYYRKFWLFGIIWTFLNIVIKNILIEHVFISLVIRFIINFGASTIFKEKYLLHVNKKVSEIKEKNINKTHDELLHICKEKGGTSILLVVLYVLVILSISLLEVLPTIKKYFEVKEHLKELENEKSQINEVELDELKIEVPSNFTKIDASNSKSDYFLLTSNNYCVLKSNQFTSTLTAEDYLNYYIGIIYEVINYPVSNKTINNNIWYYSAIQTESNNNAASNETRYYYVTKHKNAIYQLEYIIYLDETFECSQAKEKIINSLNFN